MLNCSWKSMKMIQALCYIVKTISTVLSVHARRLHKIKTDAYIPSCSLKCLMPTSYCMCSKCSVLYLSEDIPPYTYVILETLLLYKEYKKKTTTRKYISLLDKIKVEGHVWWTKSIIWFRHVDVTLILCLIRT